jgi:CheY-like chemotaxis protein
MRPNTAASHDCNRVSDAQQPILVVEDNEDLREMMTMLLTSDGFHVATANNGRNALDQLPRVNPCLILLDLMMPGMNGWDFRRAQLSLPHSHLAKIPVVLVTATADPARAQRELDAIDVIPKPIDFDRVLTTVERHCQRG